MIEHESVINLVQSEESLFGFSKEDKVLQFASYVFDASIFEIFTAIINGGQLFIAPSSIKQDAALICDYIDENDITVSLLPPVLVSAMPHKNLPSFKTLIVGGEACPEKMMRQ